MAILTPLAPGDVEVLLRHYGLAVLQLTPTAAGVENTNYFVRATDGTRPREYVLTVLEARVDATRWLLPRLLDRLREAGLPTPALRRTSEGAPLLQWGDRQALLCDRVAGAHRYHVTAEDCAAIGRYLARQHLACAELLDAAPAHPRQQAWLNAHLSSLRAHLPAWQQALLTRALRQTEALFARRDYRTLPEAIVHGDLFRDNALFTAAGLSGVIDFHHAARHKRVFDIAVTVNDWCDDGGDELNPSRMGALLNAYESIAPMTLAEVALLPGVLSYAALAFSLSRLHGQRARADDYGKSPLPMLHRLERLSNGPWRAIAHPTGAGSSTHSLGETRAD